MREKKREMGMDEGGVVVRIRGGGDDRNEGGMWV